jgi:hypothetical protein
VRKRPLRRDPIVASTIAGDDADLRLLRQRGLSLGRLPVGQKSDRRMSFKIVPVEARENILEFQGIIRRKALADLDVWISRARLRA